ncbi:hypothetical protein M3Y97_01073400 [Aphelenchoides bicaudatus]|nr:hypothetical protein M3Y97_01073400 [Aphelenchoides bicaudatus]
MFTQHRLIITDGIIFIFPHGLEYRLLNTHWIGISFFWHILSPVQTITALPTLFYYRYIVVSRGPCIKILVKCMCLSTFVTLLIATSAAYGIYEANCEPNPYYLELLNNKNLDVDPNGFYVLDVKYSGAMLFTVLAGFGCTSSMILVLLIILKTWNFMGRFATEVQSVQSRNLQRQFSRYLIAQTITGIVFAICPVALISAFSAFKIYANYTYLLFPSAVLPPLNAMLTMLMVGSYRKAVQHMFKNLGSIRSMSKIHVISTSGVQSKY